MNFLTIHSKVIGASSAILLSLSSLLLGCRDSHSELWKSTISSSVGNYEITILLSTCTKSLKVTPCVFLLFSQGSYSSCNIFLSHFFLSSVWLWKSKEFIVFHRLKILSKAGCLKTIRNGFRLNAYISCIGYLINTDR